MPPRINLNLEPRITYDAAATNLNATDWITHITDAVTDNYNYTYHKIITSEDLKDFSEKLISKLYLVISEHTRIDIDEDEFMELLTK